MFRRTKAVTFTPYGRRRSRWRLPRWLWLVLGGTVIGAGGVLFVQERYLPPRLTAAASAALRAAFDQADAERSRLSGELGLATAKLAAALDDKKALGSELAASRAAVEHLQDDLASVIGSLPPDPRNGVVQVRAARFAATGGMLAYDVVLTREQATGKPLSGLMQLVVTGESARRNETSVALKPIPLSIGKHEVVRGSLPLPEGFRPQQTTIQILDRAAGKVLGMRMMMVR
ncbi:MAG: hypothetical protein IH627_00745 [Rubrivivax sp.]|nr:hypothetical protein [Rubrivivax sp.]